MNTKRRMVRLATLGLVLLAAPTRAQPPGHGHRSHPPLPDQQLHFFYRLNGADDSTAVGVPLDIPSAALPAELDQRIELPAPWPPLRLVRYLPRAVLDQRVIPDDSPQARSALRLSIDGPKLSYQRWLVAEDSARDRLASLIGTWRYQTAANTGQRDTLFRQFETELTRAPRLRVSRTDGSEPHELDAQVGAVQSIEALGCKVLTRAFYPDFAFDEQTHQPVNKSERRLNPAALVEIEHAGQKEERWVFAEFPGFQARDGAALPFRITLDCPLDSMRDVPDFVLLTVDRKRHEVWQRYDGRVSARPIAFKQTVDVPGSRYSFHFAEFVPAGRLIEEYRPSEEGGSVTALRIRTDDESGEWSELWLEMGRRRAISPAQGAPVVWFGTSQPVRLKGHVTSP